MLYVASGNNAPELGYPFVFLALGLVHADFLDRIARAPASERAATLCVNAFLVLMACRDALYFQHVDATRRVNRVQFSVAGARQPDTPALHFMIFHPLQQDISGLRAADLDAVVRFFDAHPGNFFLLGDTSILYAATGRPSVNPDLWFHTPMVTAAFLRNELPRYEARLRANLDRYRVRYLLIERNRPMFGFRLSHMPGLARELEEQTIARHELGSFTVLELSPAP
jgi:hypothetical protein